MDSLERVKRRQEALAGRIEAGAELQALESGSSLDQALLEAGIGGNRSTSDDIFAEIQRAGKKEEALSPPSAAPGIGFEPKS